MAYKGCLNPSTLVWFIYAFFKACIRPVLIGGHETSSPLCPKASCFYFFYFLYMQFCGIFNRGNVPESKHGNSLELLRFFCKPIYCLFTFDFYWHLDGRNPIHWLYSYRSFSYYQKTTIPVLYYHYHRILESNIEFVNNII